MSSYKETKERVISELMAEHGWSRAFCVEYIMERRYNQMSHEQAYEEVSEKFRLVTQTQGEQK
jgi:hypothetical protein